ncbi:hypothetical protein M0R45_004757 [Rubus argutus]|uniref:Uncharacterized protein n=1 Tax=Rubus argutus TaxID=59490 RepID=A0AAW1YKW1_RUBAR
MLLVAKDSRLRSALWIITYLDKRVSYGEGGFGAVSQKLYSMLTRLQMGLIEDKMDWTVELKPAKAY